VDNIRRYIHGTAKSAGKWLLYFMGWCYNN